LTSKNAPRSSSRVPPAPAAAAREVSVNRHFVGKLPTGGNPNEDGPWAGANTVHNQGRNRRTTAGARAFTDSATSGWRKASGRRPAHHRLAPCLCGMPGRCNTEQPKQRSNNKHNPRVASGHSSWDERFGELRDVVVALRDILLALTTIVVCAILLWAVVRAGPTPDQLGRFLDLLIKIVGG